MNTKKRRKATRFRGSHTHGRGFKKKARGSGHRGGVGMAGTGKRGDQKKTLVINLYGNDYFGKDKTLRRGRKFKIEEISLSSLVSSLNSLVKKGIAKDNKGTYEVDLTKMKIIGNNNINKKLKIKAQAASKGAVEAVQKAGGEIILSSKSNE